MGVWTSTLLRIRPHACGLALLAFLAVARAGFGDLGPLLSNDGIDSCCGSRPHVIHVDRCRFSESTANSKQGAGILMGRNTHAASSVTLRVVDSQFDNLHASHVPGSAIYLTAKSRVDAFISGSKFLSNNARGDLGGAVCASGKTNFNVDNSEFKGNRPAGMLLINGVRGEARRATTRTGCAHSPPLHLVAQFRTRMSRVRAQDCCGRASRRVHLAAIKFATASSPTTWVTTSSGGRMSSRASILKSPA